MRVPSGLRDKSREGAQSRAPGAVVHVGEVAARGRPRRVTCARTHTQTGTHVCLGIYSPQSLGLPLCSGRRLPRAGRGLSGRVGWVGGRGGVGQDAGWPALLRRGPIAPGSSRMRSLAAASAQKSKLLVIEVKTISCHYSRRALLDSSWTSRPATGSAGPRAARVKEG